MQIGFIGLGNMGRPMVRRLLLAGHDVHVFNRSRNAVDELAREGAHPADSVSTLVDRVRLILSALPTPESVESVYSALGDVARDGQVYADHSTVSLATTRFCAQTLARRGASFLDAPVSGGPEGAAAGTLTVMVGGTQAAYAAAEPAFQAMASHVYWCGPSGSGTAIKLINQLLVGIHTVAIAEAAVLGHRLGIQPQTLLQVLKTSYGSSTMLVRNLPRFSQRDFAGGAPLRLVVKDLRLVHQEAARLGIPLRMGTTAEEHFDEAAARGWAEEDFSGVVRILETAAGKTISTANPSKP